MCNPCICGRVIHLTIKILQRGEISHSVSCINGLEMNAPWGPRNKRKGLLERLVQISVSFISTALKVTGVPGSETQCSDTLKVKWEQLAVSKEEIGTFLNTHLGKSQVFIASSSS